MLQVDCVTGSGFVLVTIGGIGVGNGKVCVSPSVIKNQ